MAYVERVASVETLRDALSKLTAEDRERYDNDLVLFGRAMVKHLEDGRVVYIPPDQWVTGAQDHK